MSKYLRIYHQAIKRQRLRAFVREALAFILAFIICAVLLAVVAVIFG